MLVVAHPAIGAALETVLQIEDRYDVRRVRSLADTRSFPDAWRPDAALIDGVLLKDGGASGVSAPTLVLSGNAEDGESLARTLKNGRGWLRKESRGDELVLAVDRLIGQTGDAATSGPAIARTIVLAAVGMILLAAVGFILWQVFV